MKKPRLLDLFCKAGGTSMGYHRAGFEVVGVDIEPQPRYPFEFHQADAFEFIAQHADEFDAFGASPPCQAYSRTQAIWGRDHPMLIDQARKALKKTGKPYVIEMVTRAPLRGNVVMLCGTMFDLKVYRHRFFETSFFLLGPGHPKHLQRAVAVGRKPKPGDFMTVCGHFSGVEYARECMGIDWMLRRELSQAIPPAYTEWIGRQIVKIHSMTAE